MQNRDARELRRRVARLKIGVEILVDAQNQIIVNDGHSLSVLLNEALQPFLSESVLQSLGLELYDRDTTGTAGTMAAMPDGSIVFGVRPPSLGSCMHLVTARDVDQNGTLEASELRDVWRFEDHEVEAFLELLTALPDGTLLATVTRSDFGPPLDAKAGTSLLRFNDANGNGDFRQVDETSIARDSDFAGSNRQPVGFVPFISGVLVDGPIPPSVPEGCAWLAGRWDAAEGNAHLCAEAGSLVELYQDGCALHWRINFTFGVGTAGPATVDIGGCPGSLEGKTLTVDCRPVTDCEFVVTHP